MPLLPAQPFTRSLADASRPVALAPVATRVLSVFQNRRWDADFLTVQRLVADGTLGDIVHFESHFDRYRPRVRDRWRERAGSGNSAWFDLGPHLVDQALRLFGLPEDIHVDDATQRDGGQTEDYFHALLRYPTRRVILHASALVAADNPRFTVHGKQGSFIKTGLDGQEDALKNGRRPGGAGWGMDPSPGTLVVADDEFRPTARPAGEPGDYRRYYPSVADADLRTGTNPVTTEEALDVMRVLELGARSARERREISL